MISCRNLSFFYGSAPFFSDFSVDFPEGKFTALLGPNGSGKTTLLKLLLGLKQPRMGSLFHGDLNLSKLTPPQRASLISYVPQSMERTFDFTVEETVMMGRYPHRGEWQRQNDRDRRVTERAMEQMEVSSLRERFVHSLSGGERQRVLIARALAQETPVMLLDEPTAFLDLRHQLSIMGLLRMITETENKTVISVVHDLNLAMNYADQSVLLSRGSLKGYGAPSEVLTPGLIKEVYNVDTEQIARGDKRYIVPLGNIDDGREGNLLFEPPGEKSR